MLVSSVFQPSLNYFCDPDTVNQTLVWLYKDYSVKTDAFVSVLRHTDSLDELLASWESRPTQPGSTRLSGSSTTSCRKTRGS